MLAYCRPVSITNTDDFGNRVQSTKHIELKT
jgi:hypothetical protein